MGNKKKKKTELQEKKKKKRVRQGTRPALVDNRGGSGQGAGKMKLIATAFAIEGVGRELRTVE